MTKTVLTKSSSVPGSYAISQRSIEQIICLTPKEKRDLVHDVDSWIALRKKGDNGESRELTISICKTYKIDSPADAYFGITGINPYRYIHDKSVRKTCFKEPPSPATIELGNIIKLDRIKKTLETFESRYNAMQLEKKHARSYRGHEAVMYLNKKCSYEKFVARQRKIVAELKNDPNIKITITKDSEDSFDIKFEYQGKFVNAKKIISCVNNKVLKELSIWED